MADKFGEGDAIVAALTGQQPRKRVPTGHPPGSLADRWIQSKIDARASMYSSLPRRETTQRTGSENPRTSQAKSAGPAPEPNPATHYQELLYQEFLDQGFSHEGAKTMVAQIGRETTFIPDNLFGSHNDPRNRKTNIGLISWQGSRRKALKSFLDQRGLLDEEGDMIRNDDVIRAQVHFMVGEMDSSQKWRNVKSLLMDKTKTYKDMESIVGDDYIVWARTNPDFGPRGYKRQNEFYNHISSLKDKEQESLLSHPTITRESVSPAIRPAHPRPINRDKFGRPLRHGPGGGGGGGGW